MMKKRILSMGMALTMMTGNALAAVYTDAPGTPTQDQVVSLKAEWKDEAGTAYTLEEMPADQLTMDTATDVYGFVYEQGNRPVRWYPEETQIAIEKMIGGSGDSLYMTELMRLHADDVEVNADLGAVMTLDIDYQPGQTTVVVLGDTSDSANIVWTPVVSRVTATGRVEFDIPQELMEQLRGNDLIFTLLTVRQTTQTIVKTVETETPESLPSKQASDTTQIVKTVRNGVEVEDNFELVVVQETEVIRREVSLLEQFVTEQERPALSWLPEKDQDRVRYLLGADADSLIVTDYVSLNSKYFRPTDGDAVGTLSFATPYMEGQTIVTALGIPKKDAEADEDGKTLMDWIVQPAYVRESGVVDVVFDQTGLIDMDTETGLLLLLSVPETNE